MTFKNMKMISRLGVAVSFSLAFAACSDDDDDPAVDNSNTNTSTEINSLELIQDVLETNADIALALYTDSVITAQALEADVETFLNDPTVANLDSARDAWLVAREPYGQSEVYRFRASPIDDTNDDPSDGEDGPEGNINAWPLGEALIDYVVAGMDFGADELLVSTQSVDATNTALGTSSGMNQANIINTTSITIDANLFANTASAEDERDVISGYHAIEFLLWGQDLNGSGMAVRDDATPGQRPVSDFFQEASDGDCTSGTGNVVAAQICERRALFLQLAIDDLIANLITVRDQWATGNASNYRAAFTNPATLDEAKTRLLQILTGMGTLSEGELGGERMQIALSADSQEDEHSCFADNTHRDIFLNHEGIANSFFGEYAGYDSTLNGTDDVTTNAVDGYGIADYLQDVGLTALATNVGNALDATTMNALAIDTNARASLPVDVVIQEAMGMNAAPMRNTIVSLNAQSGLIAQIALDLSIGSANDVVDPEASACNTLDPTTTCE